MERYAINLYEIKRVSTDTAETDSDFVLIILNPEEWAALPDLLIPKRGNFDLERLGELNPQLNKQTDQTNNLRVSPQVIHLCPEIHYFRYRDIDENGEEVVISFFLTPKSCIMIGWSGISSEHVSRWAKRGILTNPLDLAEALASHVLKSYRIVSEKFEDEMHHLEEDILRIPRQSHLAEIMCFHHKIITLKKALNEHQGVFARLDDISNKSSKERTNTTGSFNRQLESETEQTLETLRHTHDSVENLRDAYQTAVQNRTNDIMKVLTILATILLPINLLTSFFGMNFVTLPLVQKNYGMIIFYSISALIILGAFVYFWRKKWLYVKPERS